MSVEDWDGAPFQVVVTQVSGERDVYTFEAKKRSVLKEEMRVFLMLTRTVSLLCGSMLARLLEPRLNRVVSSRIGRVLPSRLT